MTKYEFLNELKISLSGSVSDSVLKENLEYYDEYISSEMRHGKSEAEIFKALGEPRLIARTIIDTSDPDHSTRDYADESWEESAEEPKSGRKSGREKKRTKGTTLPKVRLYLILALLLILVLLVLGLFVGALGVLLYIFWPAIIVLFLVFLLTRRSGPD